MTGIPKRKITVEGFEFFVTDDVTDDDIAAFIEGQHMLARAIKRLTDQGMSTDQAEALAREALKSAPRHIQEKYSAGLLDPQQFRGSF